MLYKVTARPRSGPAFGAREAMTTSDKQAVTEFLKKSRNPGISYSVSEMDGSMVQKQWTAEQWLKENG